MPDFVLCCNNICNCMIKWYENLAKELNIPMFMIDVPFNRITRYPMLRLSISRLSSGMSSMAWKHTPERNGAMSASKRLWLPPDAQAAHGSRQPARRNIFRPRSTAFDLLNHMAVMVTARGKEEAGDAMETLLKEYKENHEKGVSTFRAEEKIPYHVRGYRMLAVAACYIYRLKEQRHQYGNHHLC